MKVYALGVVHVNKNESTDTRLWYLFNNFDDAEKCVLNNYSDIFECYYSYAIIEEIGVITKTGKKIDIGNIPKQWWYKANYTDKSGEPVVEKLLTPPAGYEMICNWLVG